MELQPLEVFSSAMNSAVIKPPGRHYPGVVIQGDSLSILCGLAKYAAIRVRDGETDHEDFLYDLEQLQHTLLAHMIHYQKVLRAHDIQLPYGTPYDESDYIQLTPEESEISDD